MIAGQGGGQGFTPIQVYESLVATNGGGGGGGNVGNNVQGGFLQIVQNAAFAGFTATLPSTGTIITNTVMVQQMGGGHLLYGDDYTYNPSTRVVTINVMDDPANYANGELIFQITYLYKI